MPNFGAPRPGSEPPPRQPLTAAEIAYRETFSRAAHLASNPAAPERSQEAAQAATAPPVAVFDEQAIRAALQQEGKDFTFQIFPIGEKPAEVGPGTAQRLQSRITELESERGVIRARMLAAESAAAGAIRDLNELQVKFDTLQAEMELLRQQPQTKQEDV